MAKKKQLSKLSRTELLNLLFEQETRLERIESENKRLKEAGANTESDGKKKDPVAQVPFTTPDIYQENVKKEENTADFNVERKPNKRPEKKQIIFEQKNTRDDNRWEEYNTPRNYQQQMERPRQVSAPQEQMYTQDFRRQQEIVYQLQVNQRKMMELQKAQSMEYQKQIIALEEKIKSLAKVTEMIAKRLEENSKPKEKEYVGRHSRER